MQSDIEQAMQELRRAVERVELAIPKLAAPIKEFSVGQIFRNDESGEKFILARVKSHAVILVSLSDGNRWRDAVSVKDPLSIMPEEMAFIGGPKIRPVPSEK